LSAWPSNSTDPLILLSGIAARTKKLKLGTAIYHIYGRSPVTLGVQSATLQDLSAGRLLLGLGVANKTIASWHGGTFDRPLRRAREYIDIVRQTAAGERVVSHPPAPADGQVGHVRPPLAEPVSYKAVQANRVPWTDLACRGAVR